MTMKNACWVEVVPPCQEPPFHSGIMHGPTAHQSLFPRLLLIKKLQCSSCRIRRLGQAKLLIMRKSGMTKRPMLRSPEIKNYPATQTSTNTNHHTPTILLLKLRQHSITMVNFSFQYIHFTGATSAFGTCRQNRGPVIVKHVQNAPIIGNTQ